MSLWRKEFTDLLKLPQSLRIETGIIWSSFGKRFLFKPPWLDCKFSNSHHGLVYNRSTKTDCWDLMISDSSRLQCEETQAYIFRQCFILLLPLPSFTHSCILFSVTFLYIFSHHICTHFLSCASLHMYYLGRHRRQISKLGVILMEKIKYKHCYHTEGIIPLSLSSVHAYKLQSTRPVMLWTPHTHDHMHSDCCMSGYVSSEKDGKMALWGLFTWDNIRDSYHVWTQIPTLANIFFC